VGRYPNEFRRICVEQMKQCEDIGALATELGIHRRLLYRWRDQFEQVDRALRLRATNTEMSGSTCNSFRETCQF
ncbi:MAG TPA: helix-turn-helix domain-containing protein, partial [Pyrinomonadaceae bacterium]|nr:helix-turn-helix domain-containing protein [Pyrinomonadaceae bacterium]